MVFSISLTALSQNDSSRGKDSVVLSEAYIKEVADALKDCYTDVDTKNKLIHQFKKKVRLAERKGEITHIEAEYLKEELRQERDKNKPTFLKSVKKVSIGVGLVSVGYIIGKLTK